MQMWGTVSESLPDFKHTSSLGCSRNQSKMNEPFGLKVDLDGRNSPQVIFIPWDFIACFFFSSFSFSVKQEKINRPSNAIAYYIDQTFGIKNVCPFTFSFSEIFQWLQCARHEYVPQETLWAILFFITDNVKNGHVLNPLQTTI